LFTLKKTNIPNK